MTAEEAAFARGDRQDLPPVTSPPGGTAARGPSRAFIAAIVAAWGLSSLGGVALVWLLGVKGAPVAQGADWWASRDSLPPDALPGAGVLTEVSIFGFPIPWVLALGAVGAFIALAIAYNTHVDGRRRPTQPGAAGRPGA